MPPQLALLICTCPVSSCFLIEEHLGTYLDTQLDEVSLHDAETTGVIPCEAVWILDGTVVHIGSECRYPSLQEPP